MRADECPAVETPEFLLAALEQAATPSSSSIAITACAISTRRPNGSGDFPAQRLWVAMPTFSGLHDHQLAKNCGGGSGEPAVRPSESTTPRSRSTTRTAAPFASSLSVSRVAIDGQINTMVFVRDLTVEVVRRDRMALLNLVADKTNRAVVVTDRNLGIAYSNAAFAGLFGYSSEEAMGQPISQLLAGQHTDRAALARLRRRVGAGKRRRGRDPHLRQATAMKSGSRSPQRHFAMSAGGSSTCSPC